MSWVNPPRTLTLGTDEVHLWLAMLGDVSAVDPLVASLSDAETARVRRLLRPADQQLFVLAHAMLRDILSRYLEIAPEAVRLDCTAQGKPVLARGHRSRLRFNLAHSLGAVLCGIALEREIGVDIEATAPREDLLNIAENFFAPDECIALAECAAEEQTAFFYFLWTRKEACLKAWGTGLGMPLNAFSALAGSGEFAARALGFPGADLHSEYSCRSFPTAPGYAAAMTVEGTRCVLSRWRWRGIHTDDDPAVGVRQGDWSTGYAGG